MSHAAIIDVRGEFNAGARMAARIEELIAFLRMQMAISFEVRLPNVHDPFSRIGLRIRTGDRVITRRNREANRVKAFG